MGRNKINEEYKKKIKDIGLAFKQMISNFINYTFRLYWLVDVLSFFIKKDEEALRQISDQDYIDIFIKNKTEDQIKFIYQQAWAAKNFEIELYWKRAQYFWAFQIAAFAGYFGVLNSDDYSLEIPKNPEILFFVVCIGFITALAWNFINQGSKTWQRHWENHVDMLEKYITGPLYQIVTAQKTFSVSKINDIVSRFFVFIWVLLAIKYFSKHLTINPFKSTDINQLILMSIIVTAYFSGAMLLGYGRGRFGERNVKFFKRKTDITNDN
jgi:hypothetical protein